MWLSSRQVCLFVCEVQVLDGGSLSSAWLAAVEIPLSEDNCSVIVASFLILFKPAYARGCACCMALPHPSSHSCNGCVACA